MRIGFLSTYPPQHCGIGTYTEKLSLHVAETLGDPVVVLSEEGGEEQVESVRVLPVFSRGDAWHPSVLRATRENELDLLHIQHAPDIFGMGTSLEKLLRGLRRQKVASAITLHTVYNLRSGVLERKPHAPVFHFMLGQLADGLVAHQPSMMETLLRHRVPARKLVEIPHGTTLRERGDGAALRSSLGIPADAPVLLSFGFIHVQKFVHILIPMMRHLLRRIPDAVLLVVGEVAGNLWYNRLYMNEMRRQVRKHGLEKNVILNDQFIPGNEVEEYYDLADVALLPYLQGYGSASGAAHQAIAAGCPLICSNSPKFDDIGRYVSPDLLISPLRPKLWAEEAVRLLSDYPYRQKILASEAKYAYRSSWPVVAEAHVEFYKGLLERD